MNLYAESVPAGFPSPAAYYIEGKLDLNEHLIQNPSATFFVKVSGDSMTRAGIFDGDILILDRSQKAKNSSIIVAALDGEFTVKRLMISDGKLFLYPENPKYKTIQIEENSSFAVWGVVTYVIHKTK